MKPTTLSTLPGPILAEIFSGEHTSHLIINLWQCGDSLLNRKFAQDITYLDLKDTITKADTCFPSVVFCLKNLRSLSIDRRLRNFEDSQHELASKLRQLECSKLEILEIYCGVIVDVFLEDCARPGQDSTSSLDLSLQFPALRHLSISTPTRQTLQHIAPNLPPNLTYLEATGLDITLDSGSVFASLPRCLKTWNGRFSISATRDGKKCHDNALILSELRRIFRDPPPSLTTIACIEMSEMTEVYNFDFLPKTLNVSNGLFRFPDLTMEQLGSIPHVTKKIIISDFSNEWTTQNPSLPEWMALLPKRLVNLQFSPTNMMSTEFIKLLPRSLKTLCSSGSHSRSTIDWSEMLNPDVWPPGLTRLELPTERISNEAKKCLPATLTYLGCGHEETELYIPPNLKSLMMTITSSKLEFYPQSRLMELAIAQSALLTTGEIDMDSLELPGDSLQQLTLMYGFQFIYDLTSDFLPRRVATLNLTQFKMDWFIHLPRTLTNFTCLGLTRLPKINDHNEPVDYFSTLPPQLKRLELRGALPMIFDRRTFPAVSFSSLHHLIELRCASIGNFHSDVLLHLQSIKALTLEVTHQNEMTLAFEASHPYSNLRYK